LPSWRGMVMSGLPAPPERLDALVPVGGLESLEAERLERRRGGVAYDLFVVHQQDRLPERRSGARGGRRLRNRLARSRRQQYEARPLAGLSGLRDGAAVAAHEAPDGGKSAVWKP
jgi:hypothetical protein